MNENSRNSISNPVLRPVQASAYLGISLSTFWAKQCEDNKRYDPTFPKVFKLGAGVSRAVGIRQNDLDNWLNQEQNKPYIPNSPNKKTKTNK